MSVLQKYFTLSDLFPIHYPGLSGDIDLSITWPKQDYLTASKALPGKDQKVFKIGYKPFDVRYCLDSETHTGEIQAGADFLKPNVFLNSTLSEKASQPVYAFLTRFPATAAFLSDSLKTYMFPLYHTDGWNSGSNSPRKLNLSNDVLNQFARHTGLTLLATNDTRGNICMASSPDVRPEFRITFNENDILQYVYAILLTSFEPMQTQPGFPVIPFPANSDIFWQKARLGSDLIKLHLMAKTPASDALPGFPVSGNNIITHPVLSDTIVPGNPDTGTVRINDSQYFSNIPLIAWNMKIGEYNPARQWLADRLNHILTSKDVEYYKTLISVLYDYSRLRLSR